MAQAVSCRPHSAEDRVRPQAYTHKISGEVSLKRLFFECCAFLLFGCSTKFHPTTGREGQKGSRGIALLFP